MSISNTIYIILKIISTSQKQKSGLDDIAFISIAKENFQDILTQMHSKHTLETNKSKYNRPKWEICKKN